jgi:hypothetical protein
MDTDLNREIREIREKMNSREKGKRGERQWRDELRANGYAARRGQQFCGSPESPDVMCEELRWIRFEVKAVERLNIREAMDQAIAECGIQKVPVVAHKRSFRGWLVTMEAETFFRFLRGDFTGEKGGNREKESTSPQPSPPAERESEVSRCLECFGDAVEGVLTDKTNNKEQTEENENQRE